jgi:hypothetical protein
MNLTPTSNINELLALLQFEIDRMQELLHEFPDSPDNSRIKQSQVFRTKIIEYINKRIQPLIFIKTTE